MKGPHKHPGQAENEQNVDNPAGHHIFSSQHTVEYLNQQENIPFGHQSGQNGAGRRSCIAIGIWYPVMKRIQSALDSQSDADHRQNYQHGNLIAARGFDGLHCRPGRAHQQMARYIVKHTEPD